MRGPDRDQRERADDDARDDVDPPEPGLRHLRAQGPDHDRQHDPPAGRAEEDAERQGRRPGHVPRARSRARRTGPRTTGSSSGSSGSGPASRGRRRPGRHAAPGSWPARSVRPGRSARPATAGTAPPTRPRSRWPPTRMSVIAPSPKAAIAPYVPSAVATPRPGHETDDPALGQRAADDEQADRPDRGRDREAEDDAPGEQLGIHVSILRIRETPSASLRAFGGLWWRPSPGASHQVEPALEGPCCDLAVADSRRHVMHRRRVRDRTGGVSRR